MPETETDRAAELAHAERWAREALNSTVPSHLVTLLAEYDRRGQRIVNLEAGREVEQHMLRNAALRVEDAERHLVLVTAQHDRLLVMRDAVLAIHCPVPGLSPPACQACREHEDYTVWPCDTAAALGATLGGAS